ncbi:MAG: hypothetical protein QOH23_2141 [Gaiellaceae bacterium]|nr:hypothetical protein [Gaiellaceae bacterium]
MSVLTRPLRPSHVSGTGLVGRRRDDRIARWSVDADYVRVYSGPLPPSGGVSRPPFAVIAPHWTQFDGVVSTPLSVAS